MDRLRREIEQNLNKIEQNLSKIRQLIAQKYVRFWIDFVGFLPVRASQESNNSPFASQKQCFHHLKTVFLTPKNYVFGV